jgi:hypothetical protein
MIRNAIFGAACALVLAAVQSAAAAPGFNVQILSATTKDKVVEGAQVIFQKDGKTSITATTDSAGKATAANAFGVDDASDRKSTRLNSSHNPASRMPSSA